MACDEEKALKVDLSIGCFTLVVATRCVIWQREREREKA